MHDVFISYAHEERALARKLAEALLAARGWSVWWDTSLRTGEQFPKRIQDAVAASRCVVVLWSRHSIDSNWVVAEASEGWERQVLAPVLLDGSEPPMPFRQTQARDLSQWHGAANDASLLALIEDIQRIHAQGAVIDTAELAEREQRRRAFKRARTMRRVAVAAASIALLTGGWWLWNQIEARRAVTAVAEKLAGESEQVRAEVLKLTPEEEKKIWWTHVFEDDARYDRLELSVLLAIEGVRRQSTERTELALRDALALLPWSDQFIEIADDEMPRALVFNGNGKLLAAGAGVRNTLVWDLEHNVICARIAHGDSGGKNPWEDKRGRFHDGRGSRGLVDFSPVRDIVATAGPDTTVRTWDARTGTELKRLTQAAIVTAVAFDPKGERLASSDESGAICIWDANSGTKQRCVSESSPVYWVDFSPSGTLLASVSDDSSVALWDVASGERRLRIEPGAGVKAVRFDPQEQTFATFGAEADTRFWTVDKGTEVWKLETPANADAGVVFDPRHHTLVLGDVDGVLTWWDTDQHAMRFSIPSASYILQMAASTEARHLVTTDISREARAWDLDTGRLLKRIPYYPQLEAIALSPDGQSFATAGNDDGMRSILEITRIAPPDAVEAACRGLRRNLTRDEWHQYLGGETYRETCPNIKAETTR